MIQSHLIKTNLQLLQDVETRWLSIFLIIEWVLKLCEVGNIQYIITIAITHSIFLVYGPGNPWVYFSYPYPHPPKPLPIVMGKGTHLHG